jgi:hypothetical protein
MPLKVADAVEIFFGDRPTDLPTAPLRARVRGRRAWGCLFGDGAGEGRS